MSIPPPTPPSHARPIHLHTTPRLILRTARASDSRAFITISHDPLNSPFDGVVGATIAPEVQEERLVEQLGSTARGENAFWVIVLKESELSNLNFEGPNGGNEIDEAVKGFKVDDGYLIGMTGFNSFPRKKWLQGVGRDEEEVLVGDTGALIDHHFARRGFALEAMQKVTEVGFYELGVECMFLETNSINIPFRKMMERMGLGMGSPGEVDTGSESLESVWKFGMAEWERVRDVMKTQGKWYLEH